MKEDPHQTDTVLNVSTEDDGLEMEQTTITTKFVLSDESEAGADKSLDENFSEKYWNEEFLPLVNKSEFDYSEYWESRTFIDGEREKYKVEQASALSIPKESKLRIIISLTLLLSLFDLTTDYIVVVTYLTSGRIAYGILLLMSIVASAIVGGLRARKLVRLHPVVKFFAWFAVGGEAQSIYILWYGFGTLYYNEKSSDYSMFRELKEIEFSL
eukprot:UN33490